VTPSVATSDGVAAEDSILTSINAQNGSNSKPYTNLLRAFNYVFTDPTIYSGTVNIYLSQGDHIIPFCDSSKNSASDYTTVFTSSSGLEFINYCYMTNKSRQYKTMYIESDRIVFNIKPL
jgi:hypothetical protein